MESFNLLQKILTSREKRRLKWWKEKGVKSEFLGFYLIFPTYDIFVMFIVSNIEGSYFINILIISIIIFPSPLLVFVIVICS